MDKQKAFRPHVTPAVPHKAEGGEAGNEQRSRGQVGKEFSEKKPNVAARMWNRLTGHKPAAPERKEDPEVAAYREGVRLRIDAIRAGRGEVPCVQGAFGKQLGSRATYRAFTLADGTECVAVKPYLGDLDAVSIFDLAKKLTANEPTCGLMARIVGATFDTEGAIWLVSEKIKGQHVQSDWAKLTPQQRHQLERAFSPPVIAQFKAGGLNVERNVETDYLFVQEDGTIRFGWPYRLTMFTEQAKVFFNYTPGTSTTLSKDGTMKVGGAEVKS
jgi:hypothetical protein